ncbi:MAG TPA: hypothetical protein GX743_11605, partial [Actinomycetales bacterium]|nr:hypothetical protein [Actinomycetales bacterium]
MAESTTPASPPHPHEPTQMPAPTGFSASRAPDLAPTPARPLPSRSGAIGLMVGGVLLWVLAALAVWVLPQALVYGPAERAFEDPAMWEESYWDYIQSGQPTNIPADQLVSVTPEWVWMDPGMNPMDGSEPVMPDFECRITGPDGSAVATEMVDMQGPTFEVVEAGTYVIECDQGGMLNVQGQPLELYRQGENMTQTLTLLTWVHWISLVAGTILAVLGAYLLGTRNQQRHYALQEVYASVPMGTQSGQAAQSRPAPGSPPTSSPGPFPGSAPGPLPASASAPGGSPAPTTTPAASPSGQSAAGHQSPNSVQYDPELDPTIPRNSGTFQVRPREPKRRSKDPFDEN